MPTGHQLHSIHVHKMTMAMVATETQSLFYCNLSTVSQS